jgi:three-Cys-motif partner protein
MTDKPLLFDLPSVSADRQPRLKAITVPLWTAQKARLIAAYVRFFTMVTKHGVYIDGYAGPQTGQHCGGWAASEVLRIQPPLIRHLFLCDIGVSQIAHLNRLKRSQPAVKGRHIEVLAGDFNVLVDRILGSGKIGQKVATFALLDQRTFECDWATVRKLGEHKPDGYKIELFYFLPSGWLNRAVAGLGDPDRDMRIWWGRQDWQAFIDQSSPERARIFGQRLMTELGYRYALSWPIRAEVGQGRIMYHMIHATDHAEAPQLMGRAYRRATISEDAAQQLDLDLGLRNRQPSVTRLPG